MRSACRCGKVDRLQLIVLPPAIFLSGLLLYHGYRLFSPPAFAISAVETVEVLELLDGLSPLRDNGLPVAQAEPLRGGGGSRLAIARPTQNGAFVLVKGRVSHGFLAEKIPMDKMLHLRIDTNQIRIDAGGAPVEAILFAPRTETAPLRIEGMSLDPGPDPFSTLFAKPTILPVASGQFSGGKFIGDNGMAVSFQAGKAQGGVASLGVLLELQITIDPLSSAWIELPKTIRLASTAVGSEDWEIGLLVPSDTPRPLQILMFGEVVGAAY